MSEPTNEPEKPPKPEIPEYPAPPSPEAYPPPPPPGAAYPPPPGGAYTPPPPPGGAYPAPPPMPYHYEGGAAPAVARNGLGTAALVLSIIGVLLCWTVFGGIILGLVAVILGFVGYSRVKRNEATNGGVAIAGIILGFLAMIAGAVFIFLYIWAWNFFGFDNLTECLDKAGNDKTAQQQCEKQFEQDMSSKAGITPTTAR